MIYLSRRSFIYSIADTDVPFFGLFSSLFYFLPLSLSLSLRRIPEAELSRFDADRLFIRTGITKLSRPIKRAFSITDRTRTTVADSANNTRVHAPMYRATRNIYERRGGNILCDLRHIEASSRNKCFVNVSQPFVSRSPGPRRFSPVGSFFLANDTTLETFVFIEKRDDGVLRRRKLFARTVTFSTFHRKKSACSTIRLLVSHRKEYYLSEICTIAKVSLLPPGSFSTKLYE